MHFSKHLADLEDLHLIQPRRARRGSTLHNPAALEFLQAPV
jgi:hypothetical protein